jgi:predicted ATP-dependent serine protease
VDRRVQEAARLGYKRIFLSSFAKVEVQPEGIRVVKVADVPALVKALFK